MTNYLIAGGAGFIGSNIVRRLMSEEKGNIYIYDNFSSGRKEHLQDVLGEERLEIIKGDLKDREATQRAFDRDIDIVYCFASNPDIARAIREPDIDFWEGTYLVNNLLEAMRAHGVKKLLYASGSGVYGDVGTLETDENYSPLRPVSTYGASKLGCEALICAYSHMFDMRSAVFRFANVIGRNQTHGVGFDFIRKLRQNPRELDILGDGTQSKSYVDIDDILDAVRLIEKREMPAFEPYNVATLDSMTVTEIADMAVDILGLKDVLYRYSGGDRGWKGDVPVVRLNSQKLRSLGWKNRYSSVQAMEKALRAMAGASG